MKCTDEVIGTCVIEISVDSRDGCCCSCCCCCNSLSFLGDLLSDELGFLPRVSCVDVFDESDGLFEVVALV